MRRACFSLATRYGGHEQILWEKVNKGIIGVLRYFRQWRPQPFFQIDVVDQLAF